MRELYEEFSSDDALQANYVRFILNDIDCEFLTCVFIKISFLVFQQGLKINSYLLEKLLSRINLNVLIINLYPGNKGYSISLKLNGDTQMLSPPTDGTSVSV